MAIKYPGTNLIGYGTAQVWKDRDLTKGVEAEKKKMCPKGHYWDGNQCQPKPKRTPMDFSDLKEIDIAKVRTAELTGDNNLYQQKDEILAYGMKNMAMIQDKTDGGKAYMEFERLKNNLRRNIILSANQKEKDNELQNLMVTDDKFLTEVNQDIYRQVTNTSMFSDKWNDTSEEYSEEETTSARNELQAKYYEDDGTGNMVLKEGMDENNYNQELTKLEEGIAAGRPIMGVGNLYNNVMPDYNYNDLIIAAVENMDPTAIESEFAGKTKSGHDTYYDRQSVDQDLARQSIFGAFNSHKYGGYIQKRVKQDADALGLSVEDYITQLAEPHLETKMSTWRGIKPQKMSVNVGNQTTPASRGSLLELGSTFDYAVDGKTAAFTTVSDGVQTSITPKTDSKMYFEMLPDRVFKGEPMGFQVLENYDIGQRVFKGGYYKDTKMQEFVPNSIEYYYTAPKGGGTFGSKRYKPGEMISDKDWDTYISGKDEKEIEKLHSQYSKPWLKGTHKDGKGGVAFRFDGAAKAAFETWYLTASDAKDVKEGLRLMLAKAGLNPNPQKR